MDSTELKSAIAQRYLSLQGYYKHAIDGDFGTYSIEAVRAWAIKDRDAIAKRLHFENDKGIILTRAGTLGFLRTICAQIHLADLKLYTGKIDGQWGPLSKQAAAIYEGIYLPVPPPDATTPGTAMTPYDVAKTYIGVKEIPGKAAHSKIVQWLRRFESWIWSDETAWCSAAAAGCANEAGYETEGATLAARSWLNVGIPVAKAEVRRGDVVVFWRGTRDGWQGHVAFFDSWASGNRIRVLGGNQNNQMCIANYDASQILGFRRLRSLDELQGASNKI